MSLNVGEENNTASSATKELLTRTECEIILAKACHAAGKSGKLHLQAFTLEPAIYPNGYLGDYYHLKLRYMDENFSLADHEDRKLCAFIKCIPQASAEPEKEAIFRKEAMLYGTLLRRLRRYSIVPWASRCFYARGDLIVLEQLEQLNYELCPETGECLTDRYLRQLLRGLAGQHAASIAMEVKECINIGNEYPQLQYEITVSPQVAWYTTGLRAVLAVVKAQLIYQTPAQQCSIEKCLPAAISSVYEMTDRSTKYRNVLCHRDTWRGNVFYNGATSATPNADRAALFVDYQTARYCPPAVDVIYALYMNLDTAERKRKEIDYLKYYYEHVRRDLHANEVIAADQLSYSELCAAYREFQLFGLVYKTIATTILKVPRHCLTNEYIHVERTGAIFKLMDELPEFRKCLLECVQEIFDFILNLQA